MDTYSIFRRNQWKRHDVSEKIGFVLSTYKYIFVHLSSHKVVYEIV